MLTFTEAQVLAWITPILWPFLRVLALFGALPLFAQRGVPMRLRVALAFLIAFCAQATLPPMPVVALDSAPGMLMVVQQLADRHLARLRRAHRLQRHRARRRADRAADGPELRRLLQPDDRRRGDRDQPLLRRLGQLAVHRHQRPPAADRRGGAELPGVSGRAPSRSPSCARSSRRSGAPRSFASACGSRCRSSRCCCSSTSCWASSRASRSR